VRTIQKVDEQSLKNAVKAAVVELIEERGDAVRDLFEEVLLDIGLSRAIQDGRKTRLVSREKIFRVLDGR
jgi:hypothetical protein